MQRNEGLPSITKEELLAYIVKTFSLNSAEQKYFQQIVSFAVDVHNGKKRDSGNLYLEEHIYPVAYELILSTPTEKLDQEIIAAGILHDVIEDKKDIHNLEQVSSFGKNILKYVVGMSKKNAANPFCDFFLYEPIRDFIYYQKLLRSTWQIKLIKTCDFYNNLYCSYYLYQRGIKQKKGEEYLKKAKSFYSKLFQQVDAEIGSNTYNKLQELIVKFEQIISATEIKSTTTSSS